MKTINITALPNGEVVIEAVGFKGQACAKATKAFEEALGQVAKTTKKSEWYQPNETTQKVGQ